MIKQYQFYKLKRRGVFQNFLEGWGGGSKVSFEGSSGAKISFGFVGQIREIIDTFFSHTYLKN